MSVQRNALLIARLAEELARVLGALLEQNASVQHAKGGFEGAYSLAIVSKQAVSKEAGGGAARPERLGVGPQAVSEDDVPLVRIDFERAGAERLVERVRGGEPPTDAQIISSLKEYCAQAITSLGAQPSSGGQASGVDAHLTVVDIDSAKVPVDPSTVQWMQIAVGTAVTLDVAFVPILRTDREVPTIPNAEVNPALDVILDLELPLIVRFGRTELTLKALTALGPNSVIDLNRSPDDPVDVIVGNRVVARGELVTVAGNYGVRILDVISQADRVRSMEVDVP